MKLALGFMIIAATCRPLAAEDLDVDQLLQLREEQAEAVQTLDTEIELTVSVGGKDRRMRTRLALDKPRGLAAIRSYDDSGKDRGGLVVKGSEVYAVGPDGQSKRLPLDEQTKQTLREMGLDPDAGQASLAGAERGKVAAARRAARQKAGHEIRRERRRECEGDGCRVLARRPRKGSRHSIALELEHLDPANGVVMERSSWLSPEAAAAEDQALEAMGSAKKKIRAAKRPVERDEQGRELRQSGRSRVIKVGRHGGVDLAEETESVSYSGGEEVRMRSRWKVAKVNQELDPRLFKVAR